ncbi:class I SAM-dependent methyltransferase [Paraburkholderia caribensis]|jgi:2-polyprenyl-3-methyl-5-hydroxy-6-metoxy-1,4-benzoquinol methylase|uniref:class I SAM-dependent methyltransferase n=1 Tax=Paraburkholderia caribensis TaxID=75105 RepID=UPI00159089CB|nr:class I SAM-dependent methyltransferase [Paraburkholderia caribensis]
MLETIEIPARRSVFAALSSEFVLRAPFDTHRSFGTNSRNTPSEWLARMEYPKSDYKEYPKTLPPDDLWGQVRRTVYGKPVSDDQIQMIVDSIRSGLALTGEDRLLELGCGNGALSQFLFDGCSEFVGVDFSDYLISVAQRKFQRAGFAFVAGDAMAYLSAESLPARFTKALCYAMLSYLSDDQAEALLTGLSNRFTGITTVFLGNLPDRDRAHLFFPDGKDFSRELDDPASQIGKWRSPAQLEALAARSGWRIRIELMPEDFYQAHYRYNAVLERAR